MRGIYEIKDKVVGFVREHEELINEAVGALALVAVGGCGYYLGKGITTYNDAVTMTRLLDRGFIAIPGTGDTIHSFKKLAEEFNS